jgi:hypothetical protein
MQSCFIESHNFDVPFRQRDKGCRRVGDSRWHLAVVPSVSIVIVGPLVVVVVVDVVVAETDVMARSVG